jgi:acyl homoserine lactone synthase
VPDLSKSRAEIFSEQDNPGLAREVFTFRKCRFVDDLGWALDVVGVEERDEFDTAAAVHCALMCNDVLVGAFRAIRCDEAYLSSLVFPQLASTRDYPTRQDCWEISRFGVRAGSGRHASVLYGVMLQFGWVRQARALVAVADLGHERLLRKLGIRTRRYGPPQIIGQSRAGAPIEAVAGEIPLTEQPANLRKSVDTLLSHVEISDATLVFGSQRLSA